MPTASNKSREQELSFSLSLPSLFFALIVAIIGPMTSSID
jgi:hypothetical protein